MKRFNGYPLVAVKNGNFRIDILTNNAIKNDCEIFASTDTDEKALEIVNKINFFDDVLEALKTSHPHISKDNIREEIGKIIIKAGEI